MAIEQNRPAELFQGAERLNDGHNNRKATMHAYSKSIASEADTNRTARPSGRRRMGRAVMAALLAGAALAPAMAAMPEVPAVAQPASAEHHVGKVIFVELVTPDLAAAKQFYAGLFGWAYRDVKLGGTEYAEASLNGQPVAGLVQKDIPPGQHRQPAWLGFIAVRDVDAAAKIAAAKGAKILSPPHDVPDRGREAVVADPQGAVFAVLASTSGDPPDYLAAPGEWIWSSLITTDPDTDAAFYQTLFDYEVFEQPSGDGAEHLLLATDNYARASANPLPTNRPDAHPHWLNFVRVDDTVKMTAKVTALGGRVLVEPHVDRHGGKVAVVSDPSGAPFGLLEWPQSDNKEVTK